MVKTRGQRVINTRSLSTTLATEVASVLPTLARKQRNLRAAQHQRSKVCPRCGGVKNLDSKLCRECYGSFAEPRQRPVTIAIGGYGGTRVHTDGQSRKPPWQRKVLVNGMWTIEPPEDLH